MVPGTFNQPYREETNGRRQEEYQLVVRPDRAVLEKVMEQKNYMASGYGDSAVSKAKPQITVADFLAVEEMEGTLIRWIQRICSQFHTFRVTLNNYSGFPPHLIYLRVQDPEPFSRLRSQLQALDAYLNAPVSSCQKPHLCISAKMPEAVYEKAIFDFAAKYFHASFDATELILLKKDSRTGSCKAVNIFHFLPSGHGVYPNSN